MELISQHAKKIMEGCKERARDAGLTFQDESLEYIVTNRDMLELGPKNMIPTLYDYWVQDVEVLKEAGRYELYPNNPYETVINTRPPISFYNDNNPDWLNVMIFYHVIGHIDFFQNNLYFRHTWDYDFASKGISDKRLIAMLRSEHGRWVDYIIEFSKAVDNLVGYYDMLGDYSRDDGKKVSLLDYYFDVFMQRTKKKSITEYVKEIERYNSALRDNPEKGEAQFLETVKSEHPELEAFYKKHVASSASRAKMDILQFLIENSPFLNKEENRWMATVMEVIRTTSLYFQPQIRTKILNEGWASYWHEELFLRDDRIKGHEVEFAIINAKVTSMPRVGLNPYALGMRLFYYLEDIANKGKTSLEFDRLRDSYRRRKYDAGSNTGRDYIFYIRENYSDSMFVHSFIDQDFVDLHKLFVAGKRLNKERMTWQYYVKSREASAYKAMVAESLYHPPSVSIHVDETGMLVLNHRFEGQPLVRDFVNGTLMGLEFLWGSPVSLYTSEPIPVKSEGTLAAAKEEKPPRQYVWKRFRYIMKDRKLTRELVE
ncbi:SpoVR family protein [Desulfosediminicola flagellatus]|uniref:SpoVR family protein n=1 Tax=Desulfosediminicola flagellatus TaxID=2569541 RepID=UPI0010ABA4F0|nr:SpoVR family protein [Desulfosediminicola flagellatus]